MGGIWGSLTLIFGVLPHMSFWASPSKNPTDNFMPEAGGPVLNADSTIPKRGHPADKKTEQTYASLTNAQKLEVLTKFYEKSEDDRPLAAYGVFSVTGPKRGFKDVLDFKV